MKATIRALILFLLAALPAASVALAGSPSPPNYGNWNPLGEDLGPLPGGLTWEDIGVEKVRPPYHDGESTHIVTDALAPAADPTTPEGWVTFWCLSTAGFQYNIGGTDLAPLSTYTVRASGIQAVFSDPPADPADPSYIEIEPGFWVQIIGVVDLDLGRFKTDANGLGGVNGVRKLDPSLYSLGVVVSDENGPALVPALEFGLPDTNDFIVY